MIQVIDYKAGNLHQRPQSASLSRREDARHTVSRRCAQCNQDRPARSRSLPGNATPARSRTHRSHPRSDLSRRSLPGHLRRPAVALRRLDRGRVHRRTLPLRLQVRALPRHLQQRRTEVASRWLELAREHSRRFAPPARCSPMEASSTTPTPGVHLSAPTPQPPPVTVATSPPQSSVAT